MSNLVIVAIPDENDRVWKISSEKVPHLTLLFLGDSDKVADVDQIVQFTEHAANTALKRFYLPVDHRGELGDDKADVLFFKKNRYDFGAVRNFRGLLLKDPNIKSAYDATSQFETPEYVGAPGQAWIPHLTLGYPTSPAKPMPDDFSPMFYDVSFNRIAVWMGDYDGPEFLLKDYWDDLDEAMETVPVDVAMSALHPVDSMAQTADLGAEFLAHYGVKGMRWGVRKDSLKTAARSVGKAAAATSRFVGDVSFESRIESGRAREEVVSKAGPAFRRTDLPAVKARHGDYAKLRNRVKKPFSAEAKAYRKDAKETYIKRLETTANSLTNISGDRQYTIRERGWELPEEGGALPTSKYYWDVSSRKVKHAAEDDFTRLEIVFDNEGYITDLKKVEIEDSEVAQSAIEDGDALAHISEEPWSNFSKSDYTLEQWHAACLIHTHEGEATSKSECKLPVKTPDGALNRNGVHAAAAALAGARGGLKGVSEDQKTKAKNSLKRYYAQLDEELPESLAQSAVQVGSDFVLEHFGVKGMRWGVRKDRPAPSPVAPKATSVVPAGSKRKTKLKVEGGENQPASEDAIKVAQARVKLSKSGTAALSNSELREVANRLQLEQQVTQLTKKQLPGQKFVAGLLKSEGQQSAGRVIRRKAMAKGF